MAKIAGFFGEYRWLSNFWPCSVPYEGIIYPSVEHAYQAAKTLDLTDRHQIALAITPGSAKAKGRRLKLRKDWATVKVEVMRKLIHTKFEDEVLASKLKSTGDILLEETNNWGDRFWGVSGGHGENMLGKILMEERKHL